MCYLYLDIAFLNSCVGILPISSATEHGWDAFGRVGISYDGWFGDVVSAEGFQHLYLAPQSSEENARAYQLVILL